MFGAPCTNNDDCDGNYFCNDDEADYPGATDLEEVWSTFFRAVAWIGDMINLRVLGWLGQRLACGGLLAGDDEGGPVVGVLPFGVGAHLFLGAAQGVDATRAQGR